MTLQTAIEKAIEGGWQYKSDAELFTDAGKLLDPSFWQCLGKATGWKKADQCPFCESWLTMYPQWQFYWHRLIDHLVEGKSIESYFETL